jgi:hypothetical protein
MMQTNAIPALCSAIQRPRNRHLNFRESTVYAQVLGHNWKTRNGNVENPHYGRSEGYFNVTTGGKLSDKASTMQRKIMNGGYWYVQAARIAGLPEDIVEALQLNGIGTIAARNGNEWVFNQSTPEAADILNKLSILHSGNFTADTIKALKAAEEASGRSPGATRIAHGLISIQGIAAYSFKPVEADTTGEGGVRRKKLSKNIIDRLTVFYNCTPSIGAAGDYITLDGRKSKADTARNNKWHSDELAIYADTQLELQQFAQFVINNRTQIRSIDHETYFPRSGINMRAPAQPDKKQNTRKQALANASMFSNTLRQEAAIGQFQLAQTRNTEQQQHYQQQTAPMGAYMAQINNSVPPSAFNSGYANEIGATQRTGLSPGRGQGGNGSQGGYTSGGFTQNNFNQQQNVQFIPLQMGGAQQLSLSPSNLMNTQVPIVPNQQMEVRERDDSRSLATYGQGGIIENQSVQVHSMANDPILDQQLIGGNSAVNSPRNRQTLGSGTGTSPRSNGSGGNGGR